MKGKDEIVGVREKLNHVYCLDCVVTNRLILARASHRIRRFEVEEDAGLNRCFKCGNPLI